MTDYERGFNDGFAAALRHNDRGPTIAGGYVDDMNPLVKKISIGFNADLFESIRGIAQTRAVSFAAAVRNLVEVALTSAQQGDSDQ